MYTQTNDLLNSIVHNIISSSYYDATKNFLIKAGLRTAEQELSSVTVQQMILSALPPSQANSVLTSPCLLAIPAFDRIAWLHNKHLNSNRGIR
jgi:hypothetical protein